MSRVENSNSDSTRDRYRVESQDWYRVFKSSHDIDIEYSSESESRYENSTWWLVYSRHHQEIWHQEEIWCQEETQCQEET